MNKNTLGYITIHAVSENALLLTWPEKICPQQLQEIIQLQQRIEKHFSTVVIESIASYNSLIVYYRFQTVFAEAFQQQLEQFIATIISTANDTASTVSRAESEEISETKPIEIPVYYGKVNNDDTNDLDDVAKQTGLSHDEIIRLHTSTVFRAYALGFTPGFCYLGTLPAQLQLPRKSSPRLKVPKGSVAIAEQQTAVYPNESPGGWHIIGQTPVDMYKYITDHTAHSAPSEQLFNSTQSKASFEPTINLGQQVKFTAISLDEFTARSPKVTSHKETSPQAASYKTTSEKSASEKTKRSDNKNLDANEPALIVEQLKGYCSFQDLGRLTQQHLGFSASGASDEFAYLSANKLLKNNTGATVIEILLGQVQFRAIDDCEIAITGANCDATVNDKAINYWQSYQLQKGDLIKLNKVSKGLLTYLAIKNGFNCQKWLNSASQSINEMSLGFTQPPISQGQFLSSNKNTVNHVNEITEHKFLPKHQFAWQNFYQQQLSNSDTPALPTPLTLRFIPSPLFLSLTHRQQQQFISSVFSINNQSNRMGYRLNNKNKLMVNTTVFSDVINKVNTELSKPVCFGSIQLPPNGEPIILMKDRQTIGGYPVLGTVMQTDLFRLAQKRPGEKVQFSITSTAFAQQQLLSFYQRFL